MCTFGSRDVRDVCRLSGTGGESRVRYFACNSEDLNKDMNRSLTSQDYDWQLSGRLLMPSNMSIEYDSGKLLKLTQILLKSKKKGLKCILFTQVFSH